jgi:predicted nucleotidyltransferase
MTSLPHAAPIAEYAAAWRRRAARERTSEARWRGAIRSVLPDLVAWLVLEKGVTGVTLFGSFARDEATPGSDLDLLVDGLPTERLLATAACAQRWLDAHIRALDNPDTSHLDLVDLDLVTRELVRPEVAVRIEREGSRLYGPY